MASVFSHAVAGIALAAPFYTRSTPRRLLALGALGAILPDLDVIGFRLGIGYEDFLGHRGFSHSLAFAALFASGVIWLFLRAAEYQRIRRQYWLYLFLATASHAVLDAMTSGGHGVAFFAPFDNSRYFFPFRPILVSPLGIRRFFTERGVAVLASELLWIWLPSAVFVASIWLARRVRNAPLRRAG